MSDTPRTDQVEKLAYWFNDDMTPVCESRFVRTLERELHAANERIKQLEEAGDALCENSNSSRWDSPAAAARKLTEQSNWIKAKEAKP